MQKKSLKSKSDTDISENGGFFAGLTKAEVLQAFEGRIESAKVLPQFSFLAQDWNSRADAVIEEFSRCKFSQDVLIVRSSSAAEDGDKASMAGAFRSVLNVKGGEALRKAVLEVIASYENTNARDRVFIQPMLQNTKCSGVVFTYDPNNGAPYTVIDYTYEGDTASTTGGTSNKGCTYYLHHARAETDDENVKSILTLCAEICAFTAHPYLDIEFAVGEDGILYLLQVRPIVMNEVKTLLEAEAQKAALEQAAKLVSRVNKKIPYVTGDKTLLGNMPDWNPAEMIGARPRPLALTMYKEMITDRIWAYQRDKYGYKNLRSVPLLYSLAGSPYIDVRSSFYSFIPKMVSKDVSSRLVDYYISKLEAQPELHDKIEFDIVFSCYTPSTPKKILTLKNHGFSDADISELLISLRDLTNRMTHPEAGEWRVDRGKVDELRQRQRKLKTQQYDPYDKVYWYTEDCKRYGTLPFAGLARAAFVATQFLKSLQEEEILPQERIDDFWQSLETIGGNLKRDLGCMNREDFLERYGHLRPGTYDILSESYEEAPEKYFDWNPKEALETNIAQFALTPEENSRVQKILDEHGLQHTSESLFRFFRAAIEGREYGKFVFSWSINEILKELIVIGQEYGLTRDDCSYLNFQTLLSYYSSSGAFGELLKQLVDNGRKQHEVTLQIALPNLIRCEKDLWSFVQTNSTPNYVTLKKSSGVTVVVDAETSHDNLKGKIAFIVNADPGYDWILGSGIKGFVTCYGGANSHMAVRAMELGLPAVIGVGERLFQKWRVAKSVELDCAGKRVIILS